MIFGDIETTEKVEYEDLLKNYYEKMEIIEEQDKEIERLNNIINKMNDYLVKNIANGGLDFMYRQGFKDSYEKLQELKGVGKE